MMFQVCQIFFYREDGGEKKFGHWADLFKLQMSNNLITVEGNQTTSSPHIFSLGGVGDFVLTSSVFDRIYIFRGNNQVG
jgi:hypothetical protein